MWWRPAFIFAVRLGALLGALCIRESIALASFSLSPSEFSNAAALADTNVVGPILRTLGFATAHHAYEPASALGTAPGMDFGVQVVATRLPNSFLNALKQAGVASPVLPILPVPRALVHKGFGSRVDLGVSYVQYRQIKVIGGDVKITVFEPAEGPTWAVRLNYAAATIKFTDSSGSYLQSKTSTWRPELLLSQRLDFVEPYLGAGWQATQGTLSLHLEGLPSGAVFDQATRGGGYEGVAFMGLALRIPNVGIHITMDGEYSTVGAHTLGMQFGFGF